MATVMAMEMGPHDMANLTRVCEFVCIEEEEETEPGHVCSDSPYYLRTKIQIHEFIERLCTYLKCTYETVVTAVILMQRWACRTHQTVNRDNFFRALFASTLVAVKVREDTFYSNSYYAMIWGIDIALANRLEEDFLNALHWDIFVEVSEYDIFLQGVEDAKKVPSFM